MCGIFVSARVVPSVDVKEEEIFSTLSRELRHVNAARGPDAQRNHVLSFVCPGSNPPGSKPDQSDAATLKADFYASELRLRGDSPIVQPHVKGENALCWNGEIFDGLDISPHENDGVKLFDLLCPLETAEQIRDLMSGIEGPYAFAFFHERTQRLYFARDPLGRRSLLIHQPTHELPYLLLSSASAGANPAYEFVELSTEFFYSLDLRSMITPSGIAEGFGQSLTQIPRASTSPDKLLAYGAPRKVNTTIPSTPELSVQTLDSIPVHLMETVDQFIYHLDSSVMLRVRDIPYSSVTKGKARVAVLFSGGIDSSIIAFLAHRHIPLDEPIDLLNVAFENPRKIRIQKEGNVRGTPKRRTKTSHHSDTGQTEHNPYSVPDRVTGMKEVEELCRICPGRTWNFVEVNVSYTECQSARAKVESLMSPGRTVMDLSLALALYFASRGQGQIQRDAESEPEPYVSESRVLLNGLGADELLGGYYRHRSVYNTGGWKAVVSELQEEIDRIPNRNLGRDDRVISSHGKETRHPFLSLTLVSFLADLPVNLKLDPRLDAGLGDKMLLRLAAQKLGLVEASSRKKRAMQFGSRSARMDGERRGDAELE
ncbi:unnamed protein product [Cyclocybe aegerita]|uniref:Glutamine amidotransferase type-2 domain-containing protein n=1 Tax=Cyclocybe aegerita TaxID=1973307 RepID=A0A8S0VY60_CYCAE|nr:unnamed protein product [Cyclocybe aegerita]